MQRKGRKQGQRRTRQKWKRRRRKRKRMQRGERQRRMKQKRKRQRQKRRRHGIRKLARKRFAKIKRKKDNLCDVAEDKEDPCYEHCCGDLSCFPGDSVVLIEGSGPVPLAKVRIGDRVLVENAGRLVYEPVLTFLHAFRTGPGADMAYLTITHSLGEFRASSPHLVFVQPYRRDASDHAFVQPHRRDASGLASKIVGNLEVGDRLLVAVGTSEHHLVESRVVSIR